MPRRRFIYHGTREDWWQAMQQGGLCAAELYLTLDKDNALYYATRKEPYSTRVVILGRVA